MFSDAYSEGQKKNINDTFPPELCPYTEDYDYLSDSDLEDDEEPAQVPLDSDSQIHPTLMPETPPRLPQDASEVGDNHQ